MIYLIISVNNKEYIKIHVQKLKKNTFTVFEFSNIALYVYDQKNMCLKIFGKAKIIKAPAGFQLMNYRLVVITLELIVLSTLLDNKKHFGKDFF